MKKLIYLLAAALFATTTASAQTEPRLCGIVSVGSGIALSEPASTPVVVRVAGHYRVSKCFSAGVATGLSFYEKTLIPLCAEVRLLIARPRRWTPYAACAAGYAFAPSKAANGGFLLNPAVGTEYALRGRLRLFAEAGYEMQLLERLLEYDGPHFSAQYAEELRHGTLLLKIGVRF